MATLDADRDQRRREIEELEQERRYWEANCPALRAQYPEQYVAVPRGGGEVIAAHTDLRVLGVELERQGVGATDVWYTWLRAADKLYHG